MKPYLLHPAAVHFPIALLSLGFAVGCLAARRKSPAWLDQAVSWLLWLGTASAWAAAGLGWLAEKTAPHAPPAWEILAEHQELAYWTLGAFTTLSLWRFWRPSHRAVFIGAWFAALALLLATAFHGGELVFKFGMGVGE